MYTLAVRISNYYPFHATTARGKAQHAAVRVEVQCSNDRQCAATGCASARAAADNMVNFQDSKLYALWITSVSKLQHAFNKRRSKKAVNARLERQPESPPCSRRSLQVKQPFSIGPPSLLQLSCKALCQDHTQLTADDLNDLPSDIVQCILDEFVAKDDLTWPVLQLFRKQSLHDFMVSDLPDLREDWLKVLNTAPLRRVHLTRCSQVRDLSCAPNLDISSQPALTSLL